MNNVFSPSRKACITSINNQQKKGLCCINSLLRSTTSKSLINQAPILVPESELEWPEYPPKVGDVMKDRMGTGQAPEVVGITRTDTCCVLPELDYPPVYMICYEYGYNAAIG